MGGGHSQPACSPPQKSSVHDCYAILESKVRRTSETFSSQLRHLAYDLNPTIRQQIFLTSEVDAMAWLEKQDVSQSVPSLEHSFLMEARPFSRTDLRAFLEKLPDTFWDYNIFSDRLSSNRYEDTRKGVRLVIDHLVSGVTAGYGYYKSVMFLSHGVYIGACFDLCEGEFDTNEGQKQLSYASVRILASTSDNLLNLITDQKRLQEKLAVLQLELHNTVKIGSTVWVRVQYNLPLWLTATTTRDVLESKSVLFQSKCQDLQKALAEGQNVNATDLLSYLPADIQAGSLLGYTALFSIVASLLRTYGSERFAELVGSYLTCNEQAIERDLDLAVDLVKTMFISVYQEENLLPKLRALLSDQRMNQLPFFLLVARGILNELMNKP